VSARTAEILREAAADLEANGWIQDDSYAGNKACLVGAIMRTHGARIEMSDAFDAVKAHLGVTPAVWNDARGRTQAEVVKELLTVADLEDVR
jgi:hypothetical protein